MVNGQSDALGWLEVSGTNIINKNGEELVFHGVNVADPDKLVKDILKFYIRLLHGQKSSDYISFIDWHSIKNLRTELYQHPMYHTSKSETFQFWQLVS